MFHNYKELASVDLLRSILRENNFKLSAEEAVNEILNILSKFRIGKIENERPLIADLLSTDINSAKSLKNFINVYRGIEKTKEISSDVALSNIEYLQDTSNYLICRAIATMDAYREINPTSPFEYSINDQDQIPTCSGRILGRFNITLPDIKHGRPGSKPIVMDVGFSMDVDNEVINFLANRATDNTASNDRRVVNG